MNRRGREPSAAEGRGAPPLSARGRVLIVGV